MALLYLLALSSVVLSNSSLAIGASGLEDGVSHWRHELTIEARQFAQTSDYVDHNQDASLSFQSHFEMEWNDGRDSFTFVPFTRYNSQDSNRSRFDIQSLSWTHAQSRWEVRSGIRTISWYTTESGHLVDIVNQIDASGDIDGEDKLGQTMLNLVYKTGRSNIELYWLPGFRERIFAGDRARLRGPLEFSTDDVEYESSAEQYRSDAAIRSTFFAGNLEIAFSHFSGTSRQPVLRVRNNQLQSYYPVIDQTGLQLEYAAGDWLWKLEAIRNSGFDDPEGNGDDHYEAAIAGFEFSWSGLGESGYDLGILSEYLWDSRRDESMSNDVFAGIRLGLNDIDGSEFLIGWIQDMDHGEYLGFIECSRRIGDTGRIDLTARMIGSTDSSDKAIQRADFFDLHRDDYITLEYTHYL